MPYRGTFLSMALMVCVAVLLFLFFERQVSRFWVNLAIHPDIRTALLEAADDQRTLSRLNPEETERYRAKFDELTRLRQNLLILEHNRDEMTRNWEMLLGGTLAAILFLSVALQWLWRRHTHTQLKALDQPLAELASGKADIRLHGRASGIFREIGTKIEQTSRFLSRQQEQLRSLKHLSSWQEASRRHAHEMRTPLTAASMEVERLATLIEEPAEAWPAELERATHSILEELERLKRFTQAFTSFGKIRKPLLERHDLAAYLADYADLFATSWRNLSLHFDRPVAPQVAAFDREMIRQVLVNLCNNASLAMEPERGGVRFDLHVTFGDLQVSVIDDGPGVDGSIADRLFEPYQTTRPAGDGMGLGLAISRKIMLDHGGDLRLHASGPEGTEFRLVFPLAESIPTNQTEEEQGT